jgi:hypothetical protein
MLLGYGTVGGLAGVPALCWSGCIGVGRMSLRTKAVSRKPDILAELEQQMLDLIAPGIMPRRRRAGTAVPSDRRPDRRS